MTKGHNKGKTNDRDPKTKSKGQDHHLPDSKKDKSPDQGPHKREEDPGGGTKGKNAV